MNYKITGESLSKPGKSQYELIIDELKRNHSVFKNDSREKVGQKVSYEAQRLNLKGVRYPRDLIKAKNPEYIFMQLRYNDADTVVPYSISKYFNEPNSQRSDSESISKQSRNMYDMCGDGELEIYQFPKSVFPNYCDIVEQFEREYFISAPNLLLTSEYTVSQIYEMLQCSIFQFSPDHELNFDIHDMYNNCFVKFLAFDHLFGSELLFQDESERLAKMKEHDIYDFVPYGVGYKGEPRVRVRCLFQCHGNEFEALYETDKAWIFLNAGSS